MTDIEKIKNILIKHNGKSNKIKSKEIARQMGYNEDDTHAKTRALIKKAAETYELPLVADNGGYYIINCETDFSEYMSNLDKRIEGIKERKEIIRQNYEGWKK